MAEVPAEVTTGLYFLEPADASETLTAQVYQEGERHFVAVILPKVASDRPTQYVLNRKNLQDPNYAKGIWFRPNKQVFFIDFDNAPFTAYHVAIGHKPFLFPLVGPTAEPYTRAYPMQKFPGEDQDHPHQRSFWFTHGNVSGIDFWSEENDSGKIEETGRTLVVEGPVMARMVTQNEWRAPGGRSVCQDERVMTFYRLYDVRMIDFDIKIKASSGPVEFRDTKEGMFGIRVASSMSVDKKTGGRITNAEGLTDAKAWGQASPWVDYTGPVNNKTVGIAVLNHPSSFRYPTTWHVRTYGLFAANPFGWHDFGRAEKGDHTIPQGQSITFRYRVILHPGDTNSAEIAQHFAAYTKPPALTLEKQ